MYIVARKNRARCCIDRNAIWRSPRACCSGMPPPVVIGREDRAVKLARDFLTDRLDVSVHLTDIASAAGLPPYRLFRAFNRATGMTPHGFQRQARVRYAMDLIKSGQALAEVAAATGFTDQAHLTRHFRRMMGVTPGSYKAAMRL
jgi:AraC-like DNA-binding protein